MKIIKRVAAIFMALCLAIAAAACPVLALPQEESADVSFKLDCASAILMEASTGRVLYEMNADEALPPASVTKVMSLLLIMEAIEEGKIAYVDMVTASAHACSMGGSQIFLEEGEQMSVEDMIKSVVIASANDAVVALAEHIAGTESAFVEMMNKKAAALGLTSTRFENTNGLDDTVERHVSSARDIAVMSRELIRHKKILEYSSIWMDTVRGGSFGLTNTNRLVRFYKGATGLKTGSTAKAKFCITATAERDGMSLICVIMAAPTRDVRNAAATSLLDWGFANYAVYKESGEPLQPIRVIGGVKHECALSSPEFSCVVEKNETSKIERSVELPESISAPVKEGDKLGRVVYRIGEREIGSSDIVAAQSVDKINFWGLMLKMLSRMALC